MATLLYDSQGRSLLAERNGHAPARSNGRATSNRARTYSTANLTGGGIANSLTAWERRWTNPSRRSFSRPASTGDRRLKSFTSSRGRPRKFVSVPVDDMFIKWREFTDAPDDQIERMVEAEERHQVWMKLAKAMKAARAMGTGMLLMVTKEAPMDTPMEPERIREGDLLALHVFDRFDASIYSHVTDLAEPNYGEPEMYHFHPTRGVGMTVHPSRVIRFDGIAPLTASRWTTYEQDWGVPEIVPVIISLLQDQTLASGVTHLSQEASVGVLSVTGLKDAIAGHGDPGEMSADEIGRTINAYKSIYRLLMVEKGEEEFNRVAVSFGGLAPLMDKSRYVFRRRRTCR